MYYGRIYSFYPNGRIAADVITKQYDSEFKMAKLCEKTLFVLDDMQKKVESTELDEKTREKLLKRIDMLRMTPYYILAFYRDYLYGEEKFQTSYFKDGKDGFKESAKRFFDLCDKFHIYDVGEAKKPAWHKELLKYEE